MSIRVIKKPLLTTERLYLVPRLFPGGDHRVDKHNCLYDLCLLPKQSNDRVSPYMLNFYVIQSDNRKFYASGEIWSTSAIKKRSIGEKSLRGTYYSIDMTDFFANRIQRLWQRYKERKEASAYICHWLFHAITVPRTGWLFRRTERKWQEKVDHIMT